MCVDRHPLLISIIVVEMEMGMSVKLTLRVPPDLLTDLQQFAAADERGFSDFLRLQLRKVVAARRAASEPDRASA
jgi:hypothetical protein